MFELAPDRGKRPTEPFAGSFGRATGLARHRVQPIPAAVDNRQREGGKRIAGRTPGHHRVRSGRCGVVATCRTALTPIRAAGHTALDHMATTRCIFIPTPRRSATCTKDAVDPDKT